MAMQFNYSYKECLQRSQTAQWDLDYFYDINLDFSKPFLPEHLAKTEPLTMLSDKERLYLNQIRGYSYAYLFRFIEEYIISLVDGLLKEESDETRDKALSIFLEEEKKHQALFKYFEKEFVKGFSVQCDVIGGMKQASETILAHSPLSVMLFTTMLEWLTQSHYMAYFSGKKGDSLLIDDSFKELFRLHWVEEAQHARLDALETLRLAKDMQTDEIDVNIQECLQMCNLLINMMAQQAVCDLSSLERVIGRTLEEQDKEIIIKQQQQAYTFSFITLGLVNRHFKNLLGELSDNAEFIVNEYVEGLIND